MSYLIDAWLERPDPYLRVTHRHTGVSVIEWRDQRVRALLERGVICPSELQQCSCCSKEMVQELFLLACLEGDNAVGCS